MYIKISEIYYVSSLLNSTFKKEEQEQKEENNHTVFKKITSNGINELKWVIINE